MGKFQKLEIWEVVVWVVLIAAVLLSAVFLPWNMAGTVLQYLVLAFALSAVIFYLIHRKLHIEHRGKAEEHLKALNRHLGRSQSLSMIFEHFLEGIMLLDGENRIVEFSPMMEKISGYEKNEVLGLIAKDVLKLEKDLSSGKNSLTAKSGKKIEIELQSIAFANNKEEYTLMLIR